MSGDRFSAALARLRAAGARPNDEQRVVRAWLTAQPFRSALATRKSTPSAVVLALSDELERELAGHVREVQAFGSADGSERLLVTLADGQQVESVLLPRDV
ncbi:MAG: rRNA methyltransferase, partial [Planctomycetota bacterium]